MFEETEAGGPRARPRVGGWIWARDSRCPGGSWGFGLPGRHPASPPRTRRQSLGLGRDLGGSEPVNAFPSGSVPFLLPPSPRGEGGPGALAAPVRPSASPFASASSSAKTSSKGSWLDQEGLSEPQDLWRLLVLGSVNSSRNQGRQEMPDLPPLFDKNTRNDKNSQQPTVFNVGTEEFQWTPFPPAFAFVSGQLRKPDSSHFTKEKNLRVLDEQGQKMDPQSSSPSASAGGCEKQEARPGSGAGVKRPSDLKDGSIRASKGRLPAHPQQSQLRKKQRLWVEGAAASSASPRGLGCLGHSSGKKPSHSLNPDGAGAGTEAASAGPSQETMALNGCPMCQQQFTGKLSQLDIDSHLAKCLSESIEDVIW